MNFKINSLDYFLPSFLRKNGNFKTRDFSPLIKRVLAGVSGVFEDVKVKNRENLVTSLMVY